MRVFWGYDQIVEFEFDSAKNKANIAKHGIDMASAELFELVEAVVTVDSRLAYPETRYQAIGYLGSRLHVMVFTLNAMSIRVISLRKANKREQRKYEQA